MDIKDFEENLRTRAYSSTTISAYAREIERFKGYLRSRKIRMTSVTAKIILEYLGAKDDAMKLSRSSVQRRLGALSSYFDYISLISNGRTRNPVRLIRRPRKRPPNPKPVDQAVLDQLMDAIDNERDRAVIALFRSSGLRLAELASLNRDTIKVEKLDQAGGTRILGVGLIVGKGNKEREFLVDEVALNSLAAYLRLRGNDDNCALFVSNRNSRLSPRTIEHIVRQWSIKIGLKEPIHPHQLRHTMATNLHRAGVDLTTIQQLLGHSSIAVTQQYVRSDLSRIRAEYFAAMSLDYVPES